MIFHVLRERGKLTPDKRGLAMGAGTERLIYAIVPEVAHVTVTDLYLPDSGWVGVRTDSPLDLVMKKAPWPVPAEKIDAMAMDMRDLKYPDESFDFCWSTGAFEHIGNDEDFARHFREVDRVLKPGGVYVYTTAITYNGATQRIPHNYYFDPAHLMSLAHASPLHPDPVFDCGIQEHIFNHPHPERFEDYGFKAGHTFSKTILSFRRGVLLTANTVILTKDRTREKRAPVVIGFEEMQKRLFRQRDIFLNNLWKDFQYLSIDVGVAQLHCQPQCFPTGTVRMECLFPSDVKGKFPVTVQSRAIDNDLKWVNHAQGELSADSPSLTFPAEQSRLYRTLLQTKDASLATRLVMRAKMD